MSGEGFVERVRRAARVFWQSKDFSKKDPSGERENVQKSNVQITCGSRVIAGAAALLIGIMTVPQNPSSISGSLRLAGSSSMEMMASALAEGFMEQYPHVTVTIEYVGSSAGIEAVLNGSADIGTSSRKLKEEELARGAVENIVAMDGIAICVDPDNRITDLSRRQLADIYTGKLTNWSQLGGENVPIVVVGHEAGSGTRDAFEEALGIKDRCVYANELNSMGAVKARAALIPGAIGYISFTVLDDSVRAVSLDGVAPFAENVENQSYPLCRPFVMVTNGEISKQNDIVRAWFSYVTSQEVYGGMDSR